MTISHLSRIVVIGLLAPALTSAEITVSGITLPIFDATGRRTHVLRAERGTLRGPLHSLSRVELLFFSADTSELVTQRVQADDATWDATKGILTGDGRAVVTTEFTRLSGDGFVFTMANSLLRFNRAFLLENSEVKLTSDVAIAELVTQSAGGSLRVSDVKRCEARGNLVVSILPTARREYPCDQAFSEVAIYDGLARTITLPHPTRILKRGSEGSIGNIRFDLPPVAQPVK